MEGGFKGARARREQLWRERLALAQTTLGDRFAESGIDDVHRMIGLNELAQV